MSSFNELVRLFTTMPRREKTFVVILVVLFTFSLAQYFVTSGRGALSQDDYFTEGVVGHVTFVNPLLVDFNETDRDISELVFSGLIRYDPEAKNFYPDLAENFQQSEKGRVVTVTLRSDALWHDGEPVTADDVVFTFRDLIQNPAFANPVLKSTFERVQVEKVDETIVRFTLPQANSYFISNLTVGIVPQHLLKDTLASELATASFNLTPIGSGPYKAEQVKLSKEGDLVDLTAFENYYGIKPALSKLRIVTFPDERALIQEKKALGSISKFSRTSEWYSSLEEDERFAISPYTLNQFTALYFNTQLPLLSSTTLRQALAKGLEKDKLVSSIEKRIDSIQIKADPENEAYAFNLEKARASLAEAGYTRGEDGLLRTNTGETVSLNLLTLDLTSSDLTDSIVKQWKENLGVEVVVTRAEGSEFLDLVNQRNYSVLLIKQNLGYNRDVYPLFNSSQAAVEPKEGEAAKQPGLNFSNFRSFGTDGLTEAIRIEVNQPDKEKLLSELSALLAKEVPVLFISTPVYSYAIEKDLAPFPVDSLDFHSDRLSILPYLTPNTSDIP
ncbi:hypothetical protein CO046_01875 [Candidatus Peregrinibacteria bacterium CG_4_9_14_0_2_um_filter_53_11]|nr:MAG: hypothetical protein CO046_01875 [Candidatus Peregrinibacteria bacterium CG_4_9_14_0_2_um_filter_53_11]